jgi:beta-fructofuranosidase
LAGAAAGAVSTAYEVGCWSGSFLIDEAGTPTILYTRIVGEDWGHGQVALAHGDPAARTWRTSPADCVLPGPPAELRAHSFRDPYVWRTAEGWTMIIAAGLPDGSAAVLQYRSTDLLQWTYDGVLCSRLSTHDDEVWTGALWECPQLFRLDDDWVLLVSVWDADALHYVAAAVGDYDGRVFTPRRWQRLSHGNCAYAMTAFLDRTGRRCVMSWLREEPQNNPALTDFAGAHSVVSMLEKDADGHLRLTRHEDLDLVVSSTVQLAAKQNEAGSDQADSGLVDGAAAAIEIMIPRLSDGHLAVCDSTGLRVRFSRDSVAEAIRLERPGFNEETIPLGTLANTSLRILIDADLVEVFSAGGYGAARIRPTLEPAIRLGWSLPESFVLNTLRPARG